MNKLNIYKLVCVLGFALLAACSQGSKVSGALSNSSTNGSSSVPGTLASCSFNGQEIPDSGTVTAYLASSVAYGSTCTSQVRSCSNGTLSGSYGFSACTVASALSCTFNNQTVASGGTVTGYTSSSVAAGQTCTTEVVSCLNGVLTPNNAFATCTVSTSPSPTPTPASCSFNGTTVASGSSVTAYLASSVAYGSTCTSQSRSCSNGTLSGTYTFSSCSVAAAASCTFNGKTVASGGTATGYTASSVPYGSTCTTEVVTCTNGTLSPSNAFATCTVAAAPTPNPTPAPTPVAGSSSYTGLHVVNTAGAPYFANGSGQVVLIHGADHSQSETACVDGGGAAGVVAPTSDDAFSDGHLTQTDLDAMKTWNINAVRVPLNSGCWESNPTLPTTWGATTSDTYQNLVKAQVQLITSNGLMVILDLHWGVALRGQANFADSSAVSFWSSVAAAFASGGSTDTSLNSQVIFDLFNEPTVTSWTCWRDGGCALTAAAGGAGIGGNVSGMGQMLAAIRAVNAQNVVIMGGEAYASEFGNSAPSSAANALSSPSSWVDAVTSMTSKYSVSTSNVAASFHCYDFNSNYGGALTGEAGATIMSGSGLSHVLTAGFPFITGETGAQTNSNDTWWTNFLSYLDSNNQGYTAWQWNTSGAPVLLTSFPTSGTEAASTYTTTMGSVYYTHLQGLPVTKAAP